jgi:hypothetical protein
VQLSLSDPAFTERLASFLDSLGQTATVDAPGRVTLEDGPDESELAIYMRVWHVLHPDAIVTVEPPAAR